MMVDGVSTAIIPKPGRVIWFGSFFFDAIVRGSTSSRGSSFSKIQGTINGAIHSRNDWAKHSASEANDTKRTVRVPGMKFVWFQSLSMLLCRGITNPKSYGSGTA
jgi:hypothetical protein